MHPDQSPATTTIDHTASRRHLLRAAAAWPLLGLGSPLQAQAWPARAIRLVLPSGPGGGADLFGRPMAEFMSKELGVPVVVENKPGANGILAHEAVVRQPPDGYALVISYSAAILSNRLLNSKMSHDPVADLKPIARIGGEGGNLLVVNPSLPVHNLKQLVEYGKAQGGALNYASWGIASGGHLIMETIKAQTGLQINHVPYKTVAQIPQDLLPGIITVATIDSATPTALVKAGRIRAIAALSRSRAPQMPDVPTLAEQGVPFSLGIWYGLFGPAGLPNDITLRINAVVNRWMALPETAAFFEQKQNSPAPKPATPDEFVADIKRDGPLWKKMVDDAKLTPS